MNTLFGSLKLALVTLIVCSGIYSLTVWSVAQIVTPKSANGHLITNAAGTVIGSRQIAQKFTRPEYFHNRPSAVDYNGAGAGGSNLSPVSPEVRKRAEALITQYGATNANPLPVDLVTASGSGLDPHISLAGAKYQIPRIARTRGITEEKVVRLLESKMKYPGGFIRSEPFVNVLELNFELDHLN